MYIWSASSEHLIDPLTYVDEIFIYVKSVLENHNFVHLTKYLDFYVNGGQSHQNVFSAL